MEILLMEWTKNNEIDNSLLSSKELNEKLIEEITELIEADFLFENKCNEEYLIHYLEELLDVSQLLVNRISRMKKIAEKETINFDGCFTIAKYKHNMKRIERGWENGDNTFKITRVGNDSRGW